MFSSSPNRPNEIEAIPLLISPSHQRLISMAWGPRSASTPPKVSIFSFQTFDFLGDKPEADCHEILRQPSSCPVASHCEALRNGSMYLRAKETRNET